MSVSKQKPKGLGRGLDVLLAAHHTEDRLATLKISDIRPGRYQPRTHMDEAALAQLADSILAQGVIQPVVVREIGLGEYELIAGERRWRAARKAGLAEIPAVVRAVPDEAALAIALIENIQREQLNALEEAHGIQRLIDEFGMTHERAAAALGRSRSAVSNLLRLLHLAEPVQDLVYAGKLDMGHARALLPLPVLDQIDMARDIADRGLSVREAERRAQARLSESLAPVPVAGGRKVDPDVARLQEELADRLGVAVKIRHGSKGRGRLEIEYLDLDQLDRFLAALTRE
ncbi:ParB/RepB/Spo0J family partition protein [Laribacter hongkongensis]|uniref:ParB/RepB/Spo0J family partition protein n=1 Tax=Laribacter hongkongensis TaxID=168471 RepID=UPI001EFDCDD2|nr:ParB/RepB/Spo0J family partition protein [Laribacter hongkongensis]MCG8995157.1 ParB/RepB/Spo0J family partition protein [Laribacter hongkongensis]MCG9009839.1 ParB/RepB/Spo0J family partition protein [Laribacter hongkongensis]MCG9023740.1 ParB/RepB/Spo0J family partition protein [Laribacter hongkongensis]MCG9047958.1 ParB/RepB/Spo0J family partition protein [Laribacter hongkongensis]MCG9073591.1 ParB/RepB/Spo0J family partition protein [Laribacter hongkongensis]